MATKFFDFFNTIATSKGSLSSGQSAAMMDYIKFFFGRPIFGAKLYNFMLNFAHRLYNTYVCTADSLFTLRV